MMTIILVAIAAGCASALMFASIISGALVSLILFNLAPLPLMTAALGWGPLCAIIGGLSAGLAIAGLIGIPLSVVFTLAVALPACWLGHLALLGRPTSNAPDLEWYPLGRILVWINGFAALTTIAALLSLGADAATINATLRQTMARVIQMMASEVANPGDTASTAQLNRVVDVLASLAPIATVIVTSTTLMLNLWLAAKITSISGRLHRPWPDLKSADPPPMVLAVLCAALGLTFTGGLLALFAQIVVVGLVMVYGMTGFAVLHTVTLASRARALWLACAYAIVVLFGWPIVLMALLAVADAVFGIRQRYLKRLVPPLPAS